MSVNKCNIWCLQCKQRNISSEDHHIDENNIPRISRDFNAGGSCRTTECMLRFYPSDTHPPWFDHPINTLWRGGRQIPSLFITKISPFAIYFIPLTIKHKLLSHIPFKFLDFFLRSSILVTKINSHANLLFPSDQLSAMLLFAGTSMRMDWKKNILKATSFAIRNEYLWNDNSVGIATGCELDGPGSNPGGDEYFWNIPDTPRRPPSLL